MFKPNRNIVNIKTSQYSIDEGNKADSIFSIFDQTRIQAKQLINPPLKSSFKGESDQSIKQEAKMVKFDNDSGKTNDRSLWRPPLDPQDDGLI